MNLRELLADARLGLSLVVPGELDEPLTWVHPTDLPDPGPYLSGGELILTGGLWRRGPGDAVRFVASLLAGGARGLAYGVQEPGGRVPADVVRACQDAGLVLLAVPHELPFITVSRTFVEQVPPAELGRLQRSLDTHEVLSAAAAEPGPASLVRALGERLPGPVWLVDGPGVAWGQLPRASDAGVATWRHGRAARAYPAQAVLGDGSVATVLAVEAHDAGSAFLGYGRPVGSLDADERRTLREALPYLKAVLTRRRERQALAAQHARAQLWLVDSGRSVGVDARRALDVLASPDAGLLVAALTYPRADRVATNSLVDLVPAALATGGWGATRVTVVVPDEGQTVLVASVPPDVSEPVLARLLTGVLGEVEQQLDRQACLGWTLLRDATTDLRAAVLAARRAARLAGQDARLARVAQYEQMGGHEVLLSRDSEVTRAFEDVVLGGLVEHDRQRGTQLLTTLAAFLDHCGAYKATAQELGLHVNTVRYRLAAVERLTGRDLAVMGDRVDLFLALAARRGRSVRAV